MSSAYDFADDAEARADAFNDVYFRLGWARQFPASAVAILSPLVTIGPMSRGDLETCLRPAAGVARGWDSEAWEPLDQWTDDQLDELREESASTPFEAAPDEPQDAAGVMAQEAALRALQVERMAAQTQHLGVAEVRTLGDLLDYMIACGVVTRLAGAEGTLLELNAHAPLPTEVLDLSDDEAAGEDLLRWRELHEGIAQAIIQLFDPDGMEHPQLRTSLERLARRLRVDVESARAAVQSLLATDDFASTADVSRIEDHRVFELVVDWPAFYGNRLSIRRAHPDET